VSLPKPEEIKVVVDEPVDVVGTGAGDSGYSSWRSAVGWDDSLSYSGMPAKKKSPFTMSTALAAFSIYRILGPIAFNAEGRFDLQLLRANLSNLEAYKFGLLAFSAYRLVSAFM